MQKIIININDDKTEVEEHVLDGEMLIGSVLQDDGSSTVIVGESTGGDFALGIASMLNNIYDRAPANLALAIAAHTTYVMHANKELEDETVLN